MEMSLSKLTCMFSLQRLVRLAIRDPDTPGGFMASIACKPVSRSAAAEAMMYFVDDIKLSKYVVLSSTRSGCEESLQKNVLTLLYLTFHWPSRWSDFYFSSTRKVQSEFGTIGRKGEGRCGRTDGEVLRGRVLRTAPLQFLSLPHHNKYCSRRQYVSRWIFYTLC